MSCGDYIYVQTQGEREEQERRWKRETLDAIDKANRELDEKCKPYREQQEQQREWKREKEREEKREREREERKIHDNARNLYERIGRAEVFPAPTICDKIEKYLGASKLEEALAAYQKTIMQRKG